MEKEKYMPLREPLWVKDYILIILVNLFTFLGFQMLMPTLPVYARNLGGSDATAGLVIGFFTLSALAIRPIAGYWLDLYGRRKVHMLGLAIFISCIFSYRFATSLVFLLAIRFMHGVGWGFTSTSASTVASDLIPRARMGEGMGYYGMATTVSMALAPAMGLFIISKYSFTTLFNFSTVLVALAILISFNISYKPLEQKITKMHLYEKKAMRPAVVMFFVTMTYGAVIAFLVLYAAEKGIENIGIFFTVYALSLAVFRPLSGRLTDIKGFDFVVIPGIILVGLAMLILSIASSLTGFLVAAVVYGAGFGTVQPSLQALAILLAPAERRGIANATFFSGFDLGIGLSSVMWGAISGITGYSLMYVLSVIPVALGLLTYMITGKKKQRSI